MKLNTEQFEAEQQEFIARVRKEYGDEQFEAEQQEFIARVRKEYGDSRAGKVKDFLGRARALYGYAVAHKCLRELKIIRDLNTANPYGILKNARNELLSSDMDSLIEFEQDQFTT